MDSGVSEEWGVAIAIGWVLSPIAIILGAVVFVMLVECVRASLRRLRLRRAPQPANPANVQ